MKAISIYLNKSGRNYDRYEIKDILDKVFPKQHDEGNITISFDKDLAQGKGLWIVSGVIKEANKDQIKKAFKKWNIYDLGVHNF